MEGRQKPDPQPENKNELNDEEVIDLTQVIEGGDDDDIIDLDDVLEQPEQATNSAVESESAPIPLVDAIPTDESVALSEPSDDEIIDLAEVAVSIGSDEVPASDSTEEVGWETDAEDKVIDLMDVATTLEADITEPEAAPPVLPPEEQPLATSEDEGVIDLLEVAAVDLPEHKDDITADDAEDVIDLMDAVSPEVPELEDEEFAELESRADVMLVDTMQLEDVEATIETAATSAEIAREPKSTPNDADEKNAEIEAEANVQPVAATAFASTTPPEIPSSGPDLLTGAQVEVALERVIERIYGEKIEQMMVQTIEKTIKQEIGKIKNTLLEDLNGLDG